MIIIGIIAAAVIAVIALIALSGTGRSSAVDYNAIPQYRTEDGSFVLGSPDAPITIIEFADFACPACHAYIPEVEQFINEFVVTGQAAFEYHVFPTAGGALTEFAGGIAECMDNERPGTFWNAHSRFNQLAQEGRYQDAPRVLSGELGFNYSSLLECQQESTLVRDSVALGQSLQVNGTPAVRVRYGDGAPTLINFAGQTYDRGAVSIEVLRGVVAAAQPAS
jgi:protein-disulfide isomerase